MEPMSEREQLQLLRDWKSERFVKRIWAIVAIALGVGLWFSIHIIIDFNEACNHAEEERDLLKSILEEKVK